LFSSADRRREVVAAPRHRYRNSRIKRIVGVGSAFVSARVLGFLTNSSSRFAFECSPGKMALFPVRALGEFLTTEFSIGFVGRLVDVASLRTLPLRLQVVIGSANDCGFHTSCDVQGVSGRSRSAKISLIHATAVRRFMG